jgi:hypothetical protein
MYWAILKLCGASDRLPLATRKARRGELIVGGSGYVKMEVVSRLFRTFGLAERRPALAHAVIAPR